MRATYSLSLIVSIIAACARHRAQPVVNQPKVPFMMSVASELRQAEVGQPEYWVGKLSTKNERALAIRQLAQFYEDAITKANGDRNDPAVWELVYGIVEPLTQVYVIHYDELDTTSRLRLIRLLSDLRDPRAEPAFRRAVERFIDKQPTNKDESDLKWALRGITSARLSGCADVVFSAFRVLRASTGLGWITYKDMSEALAVAPSQSWVGLLGNMLEVSIVPPSSSSTQARELIAPYQDQLFWQTEAALLLGLLKNEAGIEPLLRVMLDPFKVDIHALTRFSLVKIGRPAAMQVESLLRGDNQKLTSFHVRRLQETIGDKAANGSDSVVRTAAFILGSFGREENMAPLVDALKVTKDAATRAVIARELTHIPAFEEEAIEPFKRAFVKIGIETEIREGESALEALVESSAQFYEPSMVPWLIGRLNATQGSADRLSALRCSILATAIKLATPQQLASLRRPVNRYGTTIEKELLTAAEALFSRCNRYQCYLDEITKPENQQPPKQFEAIKATTMAVMVGSQDTASELVNRLSSIESPVLRYSLAMAIDRLTPHGPKEIAARLRAIIEADEKAYDRGKIAGDAPLKEVATRIESRVDESWILPLLW
jgi:hypothetical protein